MKTMRKGFLIAAALLYAGSLAACVDDTKELNSGDGDDQKPPVSCEEDPTQDKCQNGDVSCDEDPTQDKCQVDEADAALLYLSEVRVAPLEDGEATCCVDFNEDGSYDNNLLVGVQKVFNTLLSNGDLPDGFPEGAEEDLVAELDTILAGLVDDGSLTVLFEADEFPADYEAGGAFELTAYKGDSDSDAADRAAGEGVFTLRDALTNLDATLEDGIVDAEAQSDVGVPWHLLLKHGRHAVGTLEVADLSVRLEVEKDANGQPQTTQNTVDADGNPVNYLAGAARGESLADAVNTMIIAYCDLEDDENLLIFDQDESVANGERPSLTTDPAVQTTLENHFDSLCSGLAEYATEKASGVERLFDVDTDGNGVNDAISVGFQIQLVGATDADAPSDEDGVTSSFYLNGLKAQGSDGQGNVPCCYDFTNDGAYDNGAVIGLEKLVNLLGSEFPNFDFDVEQESEERFNDVLEAGLLSIVVELTADEEGTVDVEVFDADSASDWAARQNGLGEFERVDSLGAETTTIEDGKVQLGVDDILIPWGISLGGDTLTGTFNVQSAQLNLLVDQDEDGVVSVVDGNVDENGNAANFIAGIAQASEVVAAVNDLIASYCNVSGQYLSYAPAGEPNVEPEITADADVAQDLIDAGGLCAGLGYYQDEAYKIGRLFDIDSQGDGHIDGLTVGFNVSLTDAVVIE